MIRLVPGLLAGLVIVGSGCISLVVGAIWSLCGVKEREIGFPGAHRVVRGKGFHSLLLAHPLAQFQDYQVLPGQVVAGWRHLLGTFPGPSPRLGSLPSLRENSGPGRRVIPTGFPTPREWLRVELGWW